MVANDYLLHTEDVDLLPTGIIAECYCKQIKITKHLFIQAHAVKFTHAIINISFLKPICVKINITHYRLICHKLKTNHKMIQIKNTTIPTDRFVM